MSQHVHRDTRRCDDDVTAEEKTVFTMKIVVLGGSRKSGSNTSLCDRYNDRYNGNTDTMPPMFFTKNETIDELFVKMEIWDIKGISNMAGLHPLYYRSAAAGIVGYDITRRDTLETASRWIKELQEHAPECRIVLVGNTADLEPERQVSTHEGRMLAESSGDVPFFETSAKTGLNCTEAFHAAARSALGTYRHPPRYLALLAARARLAWMHVVIAASHHGISLGLGMIEPSLLHHIGRLVPDRVAHCVGLRSLGGAPGARMLQTSFAAHSFAALYLRHSITAWRM